MSKKKLYKNIDEFESTSVSKPKKEEVKDTVGYVKDRLRYLHQLKQHRFKKYWKFRAEYAQTEEITNTEDGFIRYGMNTGFALVNAKVAEVHANTPQYDFVGLDENGRKHKKMVEKLWDWVWKNSGTNKALTQIIRDAMKYGTGFGMEKYCSRKRIVRIPDVSEDGIISFIEKEVKDYEGEELIPMEWANTYVNGSTIDSATEAIYITHWDIDEFYNQFPNNGLFSYDKSKIVPGKMYYVSNGASSINIPEGTSRDISEDDNTNTISVIEYWNKYKDEYIIIANDVHINPYNGGHMPIPYPHKDIPIVCYTDHQVDGDIYGLGEYDITEKSRILKDESRSLMIETVKIQGGIITIDPSSEFDETIERIGLKQFAHVAKDDFGFFAPNVNISPLELLEKKLDEDIIIETGVDFRGQLFGPNETAERVKGRTESARKRINSNIRENAYSFYERLARLRLENIKVFYKGKDELVPVKGYSISNDGVQESMGGDYGVMPVTKEMLSGRILLIPIVDSISGDTSKIQKQKFMEFFQLAINMRKADGSPLFDPALLMDAGRGMIDDVVDLDKLLGGNVGVEAEINKRLKERGLPSMDETQNPQMDGGAGIPSAQRSGAPVILPSQAANLTEE